jgi:CRP-like cAMP-binding protein
VLGEIGLLFDIPRSATLRATVPTICAELLRADLMSLLAMDKSAQLNVRPALARRVRSTALTARLVRAGEHARYHAAARGHVLRALQGAHVAGRAGGAIRLPRRHQRGY